MDQNIVKLNYLCIKMNNKNNDIMIEDLPLECFFFYKGCTFGSMLRINSDDTGWSIKMDQNATNNAGQISSLTVEGEYFDEK